MFTAQAMWARSAATSALLIVPLGVATTVVCNQSGASAGIRFWKNDVPAAPSGNRCSRTGRPRIVRMNGSPTAT